MVVSVAAGICDALDLAHAKAAEAGRMGSLVRDRLFYCGWDRCS